MADYTEKQWESGSGVHSEKCVPTGLNGTLPRFTCHKLAVAQCLTICALTASIPLLPAPTFNPTWASPLSLLLPSPPGSGVGGELDLLYPGVSLNFEK